MTSSLEEGASVMRAIAKELEGLTAHARRTAEIAAPKIKEQVQEEFSAGQAPNGGAWAPLKDGSPAHLEKTGRMAAKLKVEADGLVVRGKLYAPANLHQYGTKRKNGTVRMPARPIFPTKDATPPGWEKALEESAEQALEELTPEMTKAGGK